MTAISGLLQHDGTPADADIVAGMHRAMRHRGGKAVIRSIGGIALGGDMRGAVGALFITADTRLDNRPELIAALGLTPSLGRALSDGALILHAHEKWGEAAPGHLLGDFAYAIWDTRQQSLFCARDHFGVRPFYFYAGEQYFAFASEPRALLVIAGVNDEVDEEQIACFLAGMDDSASATVHRAISRLPAGHSLTIRDGDVHLRRYYALDPENATRFPRSTDYAEAFLELFTQAVQSRLSLSPDVGCMLSGGLDSSSICGVARQIATNSNRGPVRTFSRIYGLESDCDERPYIESVLGLGGFDPQFIAATQPSALPALSQMTAEQGEPVFAPGILANGGLYSAARELGCTGLLDGHGGDEVVSMGRRYLFELAESDRWLRVALELAPFVASEGSRSLSAVGELIANCGTSGRLRRRLALGNRWRRLRNAGTAPASLHARPRWAAHFSPEFLMSSRLAERRETWRSNHPETAATERVAHFRTLTNPMQQTAMEVLDRATAAAGIEGRYPFWDKRIVEFCAGLPSDQKLFAGWNRVVLRRAMVNALPAQVRRRRGKTDFAGNLYRSFAATSVADWETLISVAGPAFAGFVDLRWLRRCATALQASSSVALDEVFALSRAAALASWLGNRPARQSATPPVEFSSHE